MIPDGFYRVITDGLQRLLHEKGYTIDCVGPPNKIWVSKYKDPPITEYKTFDFSEAKEAIEYALSLIELKD